MSWSVQALDQIKSTPWHLITRINKFNLIELIGGVQSVSDYPLNITWEDGVQDAISYQAQMRLDLLAGKKEFDYPIVDKKGKTRHYKFEIIGTETISLPYGNIETIKAKRLYNNDKRQALAWFAPSMDYLLVRMWKGEKGVAQFDVQLKTYELLQ